MKFPTLDDPTTASGYRRWFERHGVAAARVTLRGRTYAHGAHLSDHAEVDVILDAFPYHGTTTSCEAMWMGVPVLTLVGDRHVSRVGLSLLEQVGLERYAARDEAGWLAAAARLDTPEGRAELVELRTSLRARMRRGPLCDGPGKTRELEALYREAARHARGRDSAKTRG
jgi:predicted O-linked N-acetylglucosamine transferase (SPINDLY family)